MKYTIFTLTLFLLFTSCENAQKKYKKIIDQQAVVDSIKLEAQAFLSENPNVYKLKLCNRFSIHLIDGMSNFGGTELVWKNKSDNSKVKFIDKNTLVWKAKKRNGEGNGGKVLFTFETTKIGNDTIVIEQCLVDKSGNLSKCFGEQKFIIEITANEPLSREIPPNGTFIFTVKDFEASKTGKWEVVIKGNKATIYSCGQEIWDTTAKKGDLIAKTNIIKYKGKWVSVSDNELNKNIETINGGQFETWGFKNKIIVTF